jgi:hypothetical protein
MPKLSTETESEKRQIPDLRTSTTCLQIQCCRKCGNTLKFDKDGIATDSFDNSKYKIENDNLIILG